MTGEMMPSAFFSPAPAGRSFSGRLARAQRLAAYFTLMLYVLGAFVPGDAVARSIKSRVRKARRESGVASYYGREFANRRTANGERFDPREMTAAHRTLPFDTRIRVTNLANGRRAVLRINDRGPYKYGRVLDVSHAAARKLGFARKGLARVRIDVLSKKAPTEQRFADGQRSAKRRGKVKRG